MADTVSRTKRSAIMAAVPQKNSKPEMVLRRALHARGLRYVLGGRGLRGRPDLVFPRWRVALFVHGCYWHRHTGCRKTTTPSSNVGYWNKKFEENVERDRRVVEELLSQGWRVAVIWECVTRYPIEAQLIAEVSKFVRSSIRYAEWPRLSLGESTAVNIEVEQVRARSSPR